MFTFLRRLPGGLCLRGCLAILPLLLMLNSGSAYAGSCGPAKAGMLADGGGSACYCDVSLQDKNYIQAVSPVGMGVPESDEGAVEKMGEDLLGEYLGSATLFYDYGKMVYGGSTAGGNISYKEAVNTKICSDASCSSYITPAQYKDGTRYYFENTSALGGKQVYSCEWYGSAGLGLFYFKNPQMDVPGVVDYQRPAINASYHATYQAQDNGGAVVPNQVTATDNIDINPVISCNPALSAKLPIGANSITCTATDSSGHSNSVSFTTEVTKLPQWIIFYKPDAIELNDPAPALDVSVTSGLPPVYAASGPCSINSSSGALTISGTGTCDITVTQAGSAAYKAAPTRTQSLVINTPRTPQIINFTAVGNKTYGDAPFTLGVTGGGSGNPVQLYSDTSTVCRLTQPNTITIVGAGTCTVRAYQEENNSYKPAESSLDIVIAKMPQTVTFTSTVGTKTVGDGAFYIRAESTASAYLLEYTVTGPCTIADTLVTLSGAGTCRVTANHPGTTNHESASAALDITVNKANQAITFPAIGSADIVNSQITVSASGGASGEPVTFAVAGSCSISGNTVTVTPGNCSITAAQAGNANYNAAAAVTHSILIGDSGSIVTDCNNTAATGVSTPDCNALLALYNSTGGANWSNKTKWNSNSSVSTWYGVSVNATTKRVERLQLPGNNLVGTLPAELGNLSALTYLFLNENTLSGTIPPQLGQLVELNYLLLNLNQLAGAIPPQLGSLAKLLALDLSENRLSGAIPQELGNLSQLQVLYLFNNRLSGAIPPQLGQLSNLLALRLNFNALSGAIPAQISGLANVSEMFLNKNRLSGTIPNLSAMTSLSALELSHNALSAETSGTATSKQEFWTITQTMPPSNITATAQSATSIALSWTSMLYAQYYPNDGGYYQVQYATSPGGPYTNAASTVSKTATGYTVTGLQPGTTYYFVVTGYTTGSAVVYACTNNVACMVTNPSIWPADSVDPNSLRLTSAPSAEISAVTARNAQTIEFPALSEVGPSETQSLTATASSGLTVSYNASGTCSISGTQVTATSNGTCTERCGA